MELSLREQLEEAIETIRQMREALCPPRGARFEGLALTETEEVIITIFLDAASPFGTSRLTDRVGITLNREHSVGDKAVAVQICRLRKKLNALTPPITISSAWRIGYWMEPTDKDQLRKRLLPVRSLGAK